MNSIGNTGAWLARAFQMNADSHSTLFSQLHRFKIETRHGSSKRTGRMHNS